MIGFPALLIPRANQAPIRQTLPAEFERAHVARHMLAAGILLDGYATTGAWLGHGSQQLLGSSGVLLDALPVAVYLTADARVE
jgi:hypothetical protein